MVHDSWHILQAVAGVMVLIWAVVMYFFLVPHPDELGLTIEEVSQL
jgi:hypothetical protein